MWSGYWISPQFKKPVYNCTYQATHQVQVSLQLYTKFILPAVAFPHIGHYRKVFITEASLLEVNNNFPLFSIKLSVWVAGMIYSF